MKQRDLNLIANDAADIRKQVMAAKRVVSSQRRERVDVAIAMAERMLSRLRAL